MPDRLQEPTFGPAPQVKRTFGGHASASPYPGLRPFDSDEADVFFGREAHTDRLLEILQREHFLAVVGPSGCGKSSLVRAGLLPCLKMGNLGSGSDWRIAIMRPGNQPIRRLARALLEQHAFTVGSTGSAGDEEIAEEAAMLEAELRRGPLGLRQAAADAMDGATASTANLLIVVDQFEEIFTYSEAGVDPADESDLFVNLLLEARADFASRIYVVLTMRTDFLGNCVRFHALPDAINRAQYLTPRLTRAEMESAIQGPAEVSGGTVDLSLVTELINATQQNSDELPLLQHALSRMWTTAAERDRARPSVGWSDAQGAGGLAGALNQHAESILRGVLDTIGPTEAPLVEKLFAAITERRSAEAGGQAVRRPQRLARIARACGLGDNWRPLVPIVQQFAAPDAELLQHGVELNGDSVIDLSHEALIRQWARLQEWVDAEARRRNDYLRWTERAAEHRTERTGLLEGGPLARAVEWLRGDPALGASAWRPTAEWAARYTPADTAGTFAQTAAFIEESAAAQQKRLDDEHEEAERARLAVVERAQSAEKAASLARRQLVLVAGFSLLLLVLVAISLYLRYQARVAAARATEAEGIAQFQQARAEEAARRVDDLLARSDASYVMGVVPSPDAGAPGGAPAKPVTPTAAGSHAPPEGRVSSVGVKPSKASAAAAGSSAAPPPSASSPFPPPDASGGSGLSMEALAAIMPTSSPTARATFLKPLIDAMAEFGIDTPLRQAHFLGQISFESGDLRFLQEMWGPTATQQRYEPPSSLAQNLGNTEPGDGKKYLGRGIIQIVGRNNYRLFGDSLGLDLVNSPELAARPDVAARLSAFFWKKSNLNALADADDIGGITRRISGGSNGLEARTRAVARAKAVLRPIR